jgi:hypothetical protein
MNHYIYGLYSTRDGKIRYIGETNHPKRRLGQHIKGLYGEKIDNRQIYNWAGEECFKGFEIDLIVIEECDYRERRLREQFYIAKYNNLLNDRHGESIGIYGSRDDPENKLMQNKLIEINNLISEQSWNLEGFTGVTRINKTEWFYVKICARWTEIYEAKMMNHPSTIPIEITNYSLRVVERPYEPWEEGMEHLFEDLNEAINARDEAMKNLRSDLNNDKIKFHPDEIDREEEYS